MSDFDYKKNESKRTQKGCQNGPNSDPKLPKIDLKRTQTDPKIDKNGPQTDTKWTKD